jgi:hypothetical protein
MQHVWFHAISIHFSWYITNIMHKPSRKTHALPIDFLQQSNQA